MVQGFFLLLLAKEIEKVGRRRGYQIKLDIIVFKVALLKFMHVSVFRSKEYYVPWFKGIYNTLEKT